ncbi:MAG: hypothetical protein IH901_05720 [Proteobacteria bacterium]|nr:hypothetical protein [Pseudomonadota bacterium]
MKAESPALKLGFKNFPLDRFGALKPEFKNEVAKIQRKYKTSLSGNAAYPPINP